MKALPALLLLSMMSLSLLAQTVPNKKPSPKPVQAKRKSVTPSAPPAPPVALTPAELALAERVYVGHLPCELGASVTVEADARAPGYFHVQFGKHKYHMMPVATTTGAIRLEDRRDGVVWLQLANKSMMVSDKLGRRLVDACMSPAQMAVAQAMEKNPAPSVLDAPAPTGLRSAMQWR